MKRELDVGNTPPPVISQAGTPPPDSGGDSHSDGPPAKKAKATPKKPRTPKKPKVKSEEDTDGPKPTPSKTPGTWTNEKRGALVELIFLAGIRSADLDTFAVTHGLSKSQVQDQIKANRSNVRRSVLEFCNNLGKEKEK